MLIGLQLFYMPILTVKHLYLFSNRRSTNSQTMIMSTTIKKFARCSTLKQDDGGGEYSVIGGYSNLLSVGIFPVIFQLAFCVHEYNAASRLVAGIAPVFVPRAQCLVASNAPVSVPRGSASAALTSRDHLFD